MLFWFFLKVRSVQPILKFYFLSFVSSIFFSEAFRPNNSFIPKFSMNYLHFCSLSCIVLLYSFLLHSSCPFSAVPCLPRRMENTWSKMYCRTAAAANIFYICCIFIHFLLFSNETPAHYDFLNILAHSLTISLCCVRRSVLGNTRYGTHTSSICSTGLAVRLQCHHLPRSY